MDTETFGLVEEYADRIQIGARDKSLDPEPFSEMGDGCRAIANLLRTRKQARTAM